MDNKDLKKLVKENINIANEKYKNFEFYDSELSLVNSPTFSEESDFTVSCFESEFARYSTGWTNLIGNRAFYIIINYFIRSNLVKEVDYLSKSDLNKIESLNPKYRFGDFDESDCLEPLPNKLSKINKVYDIVWKDNEYLVLIKNKESISINLEINLLNFEASFYPNSVTINNESQCIKLYGSTVHNDKQYTSENISDLIDELKTEYCHVRFFYNVNISFKQNDILVYKINRKTRKERIKPIYVKIVK